MKRQSLLAVGGWLVAAVVAVAVGVTAVNLLGTGITSEPVEPMSQASVERQLADAGPSASPSSAGPPPEPSPSGSTPAPPEGAQTNPDAPADGRSEVFESAGGTVAATCADGSAVLDWWTPAQGYTVDDAEVGPGSEVSVEFEGGDDDVEVILACGGDGPRLLGDDGDDD
ncbi:hypothetical protein HDA32_001472 [Spinactinospora alkalitolerans]|uniref:Septum formation initiator n=1 Tax=Spinactinospora alkalitolerans TaxID=687207 RepID=A0A852TU16_9ACTN|nr:septum formation initiator [Spinactinospora alkalitolerans]NYE46352.1 hypothetical protein [Spinactinospora alkalitolerans]